MMDDYVKEEGSIYNINRWHLIIIIIIIIIITTIVIMEVWALASVRGWYN